MSSVKNPMVLGLEEECKALVFGLRCATQGGCRERSEEGPDTQSMSFLFQLYKVSRLELT